MLISSRLSVLLVYVLVLASLLDFSPFFHFYLFKELNRKKQHTLLLLGYVTSPE